MAAFGAGGLVLSGCRRVPDVVEQPIDFLGEQRRSGDPLYSQAAGAYVVVVPATVLDTVRDRWGRQIVATNLMALIEKCPYGDLALRYCTGSQYFACPGCNSIYNRIGECIRGPATRGMDRRPVSVDPDGQLVIDASRRITGVSVDEPRILELPVPVPSGEALCDGDLVLPPNPRLRPST
jgi:hypothetical protein